MNTELAKLAYIGGALDLYSRYYFTGRQWLAFDPNDAPRDTAISDLVHQVVEMVAGNV